jgi:diguanylate cyclase (GGDEF)-like protein
VLGIVMLIVLNLSIGYVLALYLHRLDPLSVAAPLLSNALPAPFPPAAALPMATPAWADDATPQSSSTSQGATSAALAPVEIAQPGVGPPQQFVIPGTEMSPVQGAAEFLPAKTNSPAGSDLKTAEHVSATDAPPVQLPVAGAPESNPPQPAVESMLLAFKTDLYDYRSELGTLNEQVSEHEAAASTGDVQAYAKRFDQLTNQYLQQQEERLQSLRGKTETAAQELAEPCLAAAQRHTAAIEIARDRVSGVAALADAAAACRQFLLATGGLAEANQSFQEEIDRTLSQVQSASAAAGDNTLAPAAASAADSSTEMTTEAPSSVSLERAVSEFIRLQADGSRKFSVALVEIDQLAPINQQHGRAVSDRILQAIEQTFVGLTLRSSLARDPQRQQLLYFQIDLSAREATHSVEQVRQRIAAAIFQHGGSRLSVTLSCGVAEATGQEQPEQIVARLEEMLREAQRYGRNGTFFQEGQHSAPAIPPSVRVESRVIEV